MIIVFGSINLDLVTRVDRFPGAGETVAATSFATYPGGKGANQALAAARAGAKVLLHGAIGRDDFGKQALVLLARDGVDLSGVRRVDGTTGCAAIFVDGKGENCIAVHPGANAHADPSSIADAVLRSGTCVLLQQELPAAANRSLLERARRLGARSMLNAAPARTVPRELLLLIDILMLNEGEASALALDLGLPAGAEAFSRAAVAVQPNLTVVITLGAQGALLASRDFCLRAAAPRVDAVDTTGAGDALVGAFAAALDRGAAAPEALRFAVAAGSLACTAAGAQPALPDRLAIEALLRSVTLREGSRC
jgi:ribokinase